MWSDLVRDLEHSQRRLHAEIEKQQQRMQRAITGKPPSPPPLPPLKYYDFKLLWALANKHRLWVQHPIVCSEFMLCIPPSAPSFQRLVPILLEFHIRQVDVSEFSQQLDQSCEYWFSEDLHPVDMWKVSGLSRDRNPPPPNGIRLL